ncbi:hypothetical protein BKA81DRAFT_373840 [Phyllosticta paracitricarpa]
MPPINTQLSPTRSYQTDAPPRQCRLPRCSPSSQSANDRCASRLFSLSRLTTIDGPPVPPQASVPLRPS